MSIKNTGKLLGTKETSAVAGISRSTLKAKLKAGQFPAPVNGNQQFPRWRKQDVEAWLQRPVASQTVTRSEPAAIVLSPDEHEFSQYRSWVHERLECEIARRLTLPRADAVALEAARRAEVLPGWPVPTITSWRELGKPSILRIMTSSDEVHFLEAGRLSGKDIKGRWHENVSFTLRDWDGGDPDYAARSARFGVRP